MENATTWDGTCCVPVRFLLWLPLLFCSSSCTPLISTPVSSYQFYFSILPSLSLFLPHPPLSSLSLHPSHCFRLICCFHFSPCPSRPVLENVERQWCCGSRAHCLSRYHTHPLLYHIMAFSFLLLHRTHTPLHTLNIYKIWYCNIVHEYIIFYILKRLKKHKLWENASILIHNI